MWKTTYKDILYSERVMYQLELQCYCLTYYKMLLSREASDYTVKSNSRSYPSALYTPSSNSPPSLKHAIVVATLKSALAST